MPTECSAEQFDFGRVEGRMVERLHLGMAERTVSIAEQIRQMEMVCDRDGLRLEA